MSTSDNSSSDSPTTRRTQYPSIILLIFIFLMVTILIAACSSTDVEQPSPEPAASDDLVITISTPDTYTFPTSRADAADHAGHVLRFTAKLYDLSATGNTTADVPGDDKGLLRTVEQLATNGSNKIVFSGVDPDEYFITLFADYIEEGATPDANGHYPDKYYAVSSADKGRINLIAKANEAINNHNLDCFRFTSGIFTKEANTQKLFTATLKRCVSRVEVIANGEGNIAALKDITINTCGVRDSYAITAANSGVDKDLKPTGSFSAVDATSRLLFFFYTFNTGNGLNATTFTLNPEPGYKFANEGKCTIGSGTIVPEANIIYKVRGNFLNTTEAPSNAVDIKVTADKNWNESSQEVE